MKRTGRGIFPERDGHLRELDPDDPGLEAVRRRRGPEFGRTQEPEVDPVAGLEQLRHREEVILRCRSSGWSITWRACIVFCEA